MNADIILLVRVSKRPINQYKWEHEARTRLRR